eukprot:c15995_g1_i1.p1 GENE.c15995_g1_i1~~c15995_g1_i1.p1  ORF type:complete len:190 (-),score=56.74 c15995_g1_i1:242-811(-)
MSLQFDNSSYSTSLDPMHGEALKRLIQIFCSSGGCGSICSSYKNPFFLGFNTPISLSDFAMRLQTFFHSSPQSFVTAAIYIQRFYTVRPDLFNPQSSHKLMLAALTLAAKFTDDVCCKHEHFARCGGIDCAELKSLEMFLFSSIDYRGFVSPTEFYQMHELLKQILQQNSDHQTKTPQLIHEVQTAQVL